MKQIILASAAALAFTAVPVVAQDAVAVTADGEAYVLTDEQQIMYDAWPMDRQTAYDVWPSGVQEYYWTLDDDQTTAWWVLNDDQRVRVYEMTPEQRTMAWQQINAQMTAQTSASTTGTTASTTATTTTSAGATTAGSPRFVRGEVIQTTPAGYQATANGDDLPICKAGQQDGCINGWEKNKTGNRPLEYWPGRPASEIDEPLPATRPDSDDDGEM